MTQLEKTIKLYLRIIPINPEPAALTKALEQCPAKQRLLLLLRKNQSPSVLDVAAQRGDVYIINTIITLLSRSDVEILVGLYPDTPLHIAAFWNQKGAVKAILYHLRSEQQSKILLAEYEACTARTIARNQKHENIVRLLDNYAETAGEFALYCHSSSIFILSSYPRETGEANIYLRSKSIGYATLL